MHGHCTYRHHHPYSHPCQVRCYQPAGLTVMIRVLLELAEEEPEPIPVRCTRLSSRYSRKNRRTNRRSFLRLKLPPYLRQPMKLQNQCWTLAPEAPNAPAQMKHPGGETKRDWGSYIATVVVYTVKGTRVGTN